MLWKSAKLEVEGVIRETCDKVLSDPEVSREKRDLRAAAMQLMGEVSVTRAIADKRWIVGSQETKGAVGRERLYHNTASHNPLGATTLHAPCPFIFSPLPVTVAAKPTPLLPTTR